MSAFNTEIAAETKTQEKLSKAESRRARVEDLKNKISLGSYRVNSIELAQAVLRAVESSPKY